MNTQSINLIAAARRIASSAAAAFGHSAERVGLIMANGSAKLATVFDAACAYLGGVAQQPCFAQQGHGYQAEQHSLSKHPGATPQVAGGYL